ncbi:MAG: diguanylate cyclase [Thermoleophilaceae bacterium]
MSDERSTLKAPDPVEAGVDSGAARRLPSTPRPEPRETSGMTSLLLLTYLERAAGRAAVDDLLRRAGAVDREAELRDEGSWFSYALKVRLFEALADVLDDPQATRRMGEAALDLQVATGLKVALRALGSPRLLYKNVVRANAKFSTVHTMDLVELRPTSARVAFRDAGDGPIHPLDCDYTQGLLACAPGLFGLPKARISHARCGARSGGGPCVYDIAWEPSRTRSLVLSGMAGAVAFGGSALLSPALVPFGAGAALGAAGFAGATEIRARRARWRRLEAELEDHLESGERLSDSLKDLVSELRLEDVLAKITANGRDAVGGKEFALLVDEPGGPRCQSSSGLPPEVVAALEAWARAEARDVEEPALVDDVGCVPELARLPDHPRMSVGSLCAAPLVYRGRTLGLLVALGAQRRTFLPRDVDQLQAYATQAAVALENARLYEAQEALASRDALTGLRNHRDFHERIGEELDRLRRHEGRLAVLLVDLDGFKSVNDESGHAAGDRVLRHVARAIEGACRSSDVAFRVGGDEFAVILPGAGHDDACEVAERVTAAVDSVDARTSASVGTAVWPDDGGSKDVLLAHADGSLYSAKARKDGDRRAAGPAPPGERRLAVVNRLAHRLTDLLDPADIARATVRELDRSLGYVLACVLKVGDDGVLRVDAGAGPLAREVAVASWTQPLDRGVLGRVVRSGRPALVDDAELDPDHLGPDFLDPAVHTRLRSELAVPIRVGSRVWGVLNLEDTRVGAFDANDLLLAEAVAAHMGAALHRSELHASLEGAFTTTIAVLCDALEAKDLYTAGHADVAELAVAVAHRLGLDDAACRLVGYAGLMHDVGKVAVRTEVLTKPGPLDAAEYEEMKQHVVVGAQMLERIPFLTGVAPLVRSSHERWDGAGYPDGLAGEAIAPGARVIAVCDAWHAMTSDRPYRAALPRADAEAELRRHAGSQFDPATVKALLSELEARQSRAGH